MISFSSIWAIVLRHGRMWQRDPNLILAGLYWPLLDILIWGFLGSWIQQAGSAEFHNYRSTALLGILMWQVVARGSIITVSTLTEELWSHNIVNLFSLPLRTREWMCGAVLFSMIVTSIIASCCMLLIYMLYNIPLGQSLWTFFIFLPPLFFSSIWLAFTCLQIIVTLGKRGVEFGYVVAWSLVPFSGAYYPTTVLPSWGQTISSFVPMSSVFEGMRGYLMHGQDPMPYLVRGYVMSILYAVVAVGLFLYCFNRSKHNGLARLID